MKKRRGRWYQHWGNDGKPSAVSGGGKKKKNASKSAASALSGNGERALGKRNRAWHV